MTSRQRRLAYLASWLLWTVACDPSLQVVGEFDVAAGRNVNVPMSGAGMEAAAGAEAGGGAGFDASLAVGADAGGPAAGSGGGESDASAGAPASEPLGSVEIETGSLEQFCNGRGPPVRVRPSAGSPPGTCPAGIARRFFAHGLCSCGNAVLNGLSFSIDSFDSRQGAYAPGTGEDRAAVGVNGLLRPITSDVQLRGDVTIAGQGKLALWGSSFLVAGDLRTNAEIEVGGSGILFASDVWANADIRVLSSTPPQVGGDLYQTPGHAGGDMLEVVGSSATTDFVVSPPCACDPASVLDIAALVAQARVSNDNDEVGVKPDSLSLDTVPPPILGEMPCGRFLFTNVSIPFGTILTSVPHRTALFVDGNFELSASTLTLDTGATGELDVFINGDLTLMFSSVLVNIARPSTVRFYVAGAIAIELGTINAQLYAPRATLELPGPPFTSDLYGSVFVGEFIANGAQVIHYDRAILEADAACQPSP